MVRLYKCMESLKSALSTLLGDQVQKLDEGDCKLLLEAQVKSLANLKCVSEKTLHEIGLATILVNNILGAQRCTTYPPLLCL